MLQTASACTSFSYSTLFRVSTWFACGSVVKLQIFFIMAGLLQLSCVHVVAYSQTVIMAAVWHFSCPEMPSITKFSRAGLLQQICALPDNGKDEMLITVIQSVSQVLHSVQQV